MAFLVSCSSVLMFRCGVSHDALGRLLLMGHITIRMMFSPRADSAEWGLSILAIIWGLVLNVLL